MKDNVVLTPPSPTQDANEPTSAERRANARANPNYPPRRDYTLYKPNSRGIGAAVRFSVSREKEAIFVEAAAQAGDRQFDWENKIIMKWGLSDIGEVLAVLQDRQPSAKLFHQTAKGNSSCELTTRDDPERAPHMLAISRQFAASGEVRKAVIPVTHAEAAVLETALRAAITRLLRW